MKRPFLTGAAVGALGLFMWLRRGWFLGLFQHAKSVFHGFGEAGVPGALTAALTAMGPPDAGPIAIRQIRRYAFAASQDQSPVVGLTHASYALVLLDTVEEMLGREALKGVTGVDPTRMRTFITAQQDRHAKVLERCDPYLLSVLKMERDSGKLPGFILQGAGSAPRGA